MPDQPQEGGLFDWLSVVSVRRLSGRVGKAMIPRVFGAELVIRAEKGHSAAWLERLARCTASRGMVGKDGPLAVAGARVAVRSAGPAFVMRVTAQKRSSAQEIYRRALRLTPASAAL